MNVFIDTNIFLSFFHYSSVELEELNKLIVLIKNHQIHLLLPEQVKQEFYRNRDNKIADALKRLKEDRIEQAFPQMVKQYEEYKLLQDSLSSFEKNKKILLSKLQVDIETNNLKADRIIAVLFSLSENIDFNEDIINAAKFRFDIGNPPGKNNSYGDSINWESLLRVSPDDEDLHFISDDSDYFSKVNPKGFNPFLIQEWNTIKHSVIIPYQNLTSYFKSNFPDIKLANELEKEIVVDAFAKSSNFSKTHIMTHQLSLISGFSKQQLNTIAKASVTNSQIYWIADDVDINEILREILVPNRHLIDEEVYTQFVEKYCKDDQETKKNKI